MTKERKLAIRMWLWIRDHQELMREQEDGEDAFMDLKALFFTSEGIKSPDWASNCWFCHYIMKRQKRGFNWRGCGKCPLRSCSSGPYYTLTHYPSEKEWEEACTDILVCLGWSEDS